MPEVATRRSYSVAEVAQMHAVDHGKVLAWIASGELAAFNAAERRGRRPRWRITLAALECFEAARASTPPPQRPERIQRPKRPPGYVHYV